MGEAKLGNKAEIPLTAANFVKAVRRLDRGKGKSGRGCLAWLLHYAFDERLPLLRLLNYRPSMVVKAMQTLEAYNPVAAKAFEAWWRGSSSRRSEAGFARFVTRHPDHKLTRQQGRTVRRKLLDLGIDPDLPIDAYNVLFAQTHVWDMTTADRMPYVLALEEGDRKVIAKHMTSSRSRSVAIIGEVSATVRHMLESAEAPAVSVQPATSMAMVELPKSSPSKVARSRTVNEVRRGNRTSISTSA